MVLFKAQRLIQIQMDELQSRMVNAWQDIAIETSREGPYVY